MVFIELKSSYIETFSSSPEMMNVIDFIVNQKSNVSPISEQGGLDQSVNSLIRSIVDKENDAFSQIEDSYKRKNPDSNSPWINNNYLIFSLLIGQGIFGRDSQWLKTAIAVRKRSDEESGIILDFFNCIISNSAPPAGPLCPLYLTYVYHVEQDSITSAIANEAIIELNKVKTFPLFQNEFLNLLYLGAFQAVLISKDIINLNLNHRVREFRLKSNKRISFLSNLTLYSLFCLFLVAAFFFIKNVFLNLSETWRNGIITVIGLLGLTFLEVFRGRKKMKNWIHNSIRRFLRIDLLDNEQSKQ